MSINCCKASVILSLSLGPSSSSSSIILIFLDSRLALAKAAAVPVDEDWTELCLASTNVDKGLWWGSNRFETGTTLLLADDSDVADIGMEAILQAAREPESTWSSGVPTVWLIMSFSTKTSEKEEGERKMNYQASNCDDVLSIIRKKVRIYIVLPMVVTSDIGNWPKKSNAIAIEILTHESNAIVIKYALLSWKK